MMFSANMLQLLLLLTYEQETESVALPMKKVFLKNLQNVQKTPVQDSSFKIVFTAYVLFLLI